ncbi:MAG: putative toxin-antitoxin system toxin component, PIN family [Spirochaetia bacterium]|nr:putative toxin-antitoxin system toxin component, PIN family [Spirochaetia bacterium]
MKVILDTNILISASIFGGLSADILDFSYLNFNVYISDFILFEYKTILSKKLKVPNNIINNKLRLLKENLILTEPDNNIPNICSDTDDNYILQLAEFVDADYIVTGDKAFQEIKKYKSCAIVSPREYWQLIKK